DVRLPQAELLQERRDLLHLLRRGGEHVRVSALLELDQNGRELDQLAGRPEDDQDHEARRARASSKRPRHIPRPWPTAYSGVATASVASSRGVRPARTPSAAAATPQPASATGATSGRRSAATATAALAG